MKKCPKLLVVDDETIVRQLIELYLADINIEVIEAEDGVQAWKILEESYSEIDLVLLDRMMPNMNGMELLAKINKCPEMKDIPVIMQTAAGSTVQVQEGMSAGVFHYLIKPYDDKILVSLVKTALAKHRNATGLRTKLSDYHQMLNLIDECDLSFRTLSDAQSLSILLASFYPNPDSVVVGISELLVNALEHGNLNISFNDKTELHKGSQWSNEIEKRQSLPENKDKKVRIFFMKTDAEIILNIRDEGDGFDWKNYLDLSPDVLTGSHGRGIPMCNHLYFDKLEYIGNGNEVCAITCLKK